MAQSGIRYRTQKETWPMTTFLFSKWDIPLWWSKVAVFKTINYTGFTEFMCTYPHTFKKNNWPNKNRNTYRNVDVRCIFPSKYTYHKKQNIISSRIGISDPVLRSFQEVLMQRIVLIKTDLTSFFMCNYLFPYCIKQTSRFRHIVRFLWYCKWHFNSILQWQCKVTKALVSVWRNQRDALFIQFIKD
jgi:hypothetical protein